MPHQTKSHIPALDNATSVSLTEKNAALEVKYILEELCADLGYDHALYAAMIPAKDGCGVTFEGHATYPLEWQKKYIEEGYIQRDPRALRPFNSVSPIDWIEFQNDANFIEITNAAKEYGLPSTGMTLPIRGPSMGVGKGASVGFAQLGVSKHVSDRDQWSQLKNESMVALQEYVAEIYIVFSRYAELSAAIMDDEMKYLSPKETEILTLISQGYSSTAAAQKLHRSERTVEVHLRAIRSKLQANSTAHAIAIAYKRGIID